MAEKREVWNLKDIMSNETYDSILQKIESNAKEIESYRPLLSPNLSSSEMLKIIKMFEQTEKLFSRISSYYSLKSSIDTKDEESLAKLTALSMKGADFSSRTMFFELWFIGLDDKDASKFIKSKELQRYKYFLEGMRLYKPHTRSEEVEQILSIKDVTGGDSFSNIYDILTNSYKFSFNGKKGLTQEEVASFLMSPNAKLREKAYKAIYSKYKEESTVLSELYKGIVLDWANEAIKIRNYKSSIAARNINNRLDDESVDVFLNVVRKNTKIFSEYFKLKNELLRKKGQKVDYSRYHIYAPFEVKEKKYSYDESKKIVLDTFRKLDERFYLAAKKLFDEKHIHSHPAQGKRSGAFCATVSTDITPYVMLNHTGKLNDVFTMMHELGHAIHSQFASKQPEFLSHPKIPLAETASIFSEIVLLHRFIDESKSKDEKTSLLVKFMDSHYVSVPRQAYFIIFEKWAHENIKEGVTKKQMDDYYHSLLKEQFGEMNIPELFDHEWNYIPHIHHTPFYTYGYAWGHLLSLSLYGMYKEQGKKFVDKYVNLLSAGASNSTTNIMLDIGANPKSEEFWQKGFDIIKLELEELKKLSK